MEQCVQLNEQSLQKFEKMFGNFKLLIQKNVKNWNQRHEVMDKFNRTLNSKFLSLMQCVEMVKNNSFVFEKLLKSQWRNFENFFNYQIALNRQDDIDRDSLSLMGLKE